MKPGWPETAESICQRCGGSCCTCGTRPPVSHSCHEQLLAHGVPPDAFEYSGYLRLKAKKNACILFDSGRCRYHAIRPETCRAGPFTFDVTGDRIGIYLKTESICPLVRLLKEDPEACKEQFRTAVFNIRFLVQSLKNEEIAAICAIDEPDTVLVAAVPRDKGDAP